MVATRQLYADLGTDFTGLNSYFKYFSNHQHRLQPGDAPVGAAAARHAVALAGSSNSSVSTPSRRKAMNTCSPCSGSQR